MAKYVRQWDWLVRICHWLIAIGFIMNRFIDEAGMTLHVWIGYGLAVVVVIRILWGLCPISGPARLDRFFPWPSAIKAHLVELKARQPHTEFGHNPLGALAIWGFWLGMLAMALTGWGIDSEALADYPMQDIHEVIANLLTALVILHLAALYFMTKWTRYNYLATMVPHPVREKDPSSTHE